MIFSQYRDQMREGLWDNNVALSQMLALCPMLAVTSTATNGLGMGIATLAVMILANLTISLLRGIIPSEVRLPVFVMLVAAIVTLVDMYLNAYLHQLHKVLGLFIALIVTNCAVFARVESFAYHQPVNKSIADGLFMGLGFTFALVIIGAVREVFGSGTLFAGASLLLGESFSFLELKLIDNYDGFLLMILPPGAFIALGFILAGKRLIDARMARAEEAELEPSTQNQ
jgi:electron transport complex protein RnfE